MREIRSITDVAPGILFVEGPASNWTVFSGGGTVELVDCGYPADRPLVEESIRLAGAEPSALRRILITHGHSDHLGASRELAREHGAAVQATADELPNVRREVTEQVTVPDLLPSILKRGTLRWAVAAVRAGGLGDVGAGQATALDSEALTLSTGHRLLVVATPGHTSGHACFFEPDARALLTGDAVVTGHPLLRDAGRLQQLPAFFHHDVARAERSAQLLDLCDTAVVLPGHGPLLRLRPAA